MRVHLINPSNTSFGIGVITPRWLYVLAAATPAKYGDPIITDETLERKQPDRIEAGDVVGISIHTGNALRGMEVGRIARERAGLWSFTAESTPLCSRKRPWNWAARISS
jgi:hypothetical protein